MYLFLCICLCMFTFMHVVILLCCRTLCVLDVRLLSDIWFANTVILVPFYSLPFHSVNSVLWCSPVYQVFAFLYMVLLTLKELSSTLNYVTLWNCCHQNYIKTTEPEYQWNALADLCTGSSNRISNDSGKCGWIPLCFCKKWLLIVRLLPSWYP